MGKITSTFLLSILILLFSGCSVGKQVVGEFYLEGKKFDRGEKYFQKKINEDENDASSHYYYGRFLLANKENPKALMHLKKAVLLNSKNSNYYSWLGVAYSKTKQPAKEKAAYQKALTIDKNNLQALTYLSHNFYEAKEYQKALDTYAKVLKLQPYNQYALYNRALSLKKLKRVPEEKLAWRVFLEYYPSGRLAQNAVKHLNKYGIFNYKNHIIGIKRVTLQDIIFEPFTLKITFDSTNSLDVLGKILSDKQDIKIHIISYQQNNILLAKEKVKAIKKYILKKYPKISQDRLVLSWFDKPKVIKADKKVYIQGEYIDFITVVKKSKRS